MAGFHDDVHAKRAEIDAQRHAQQQHDDALRHAEEAAQRLAAAVGPAVARLTADARDVLLASQVQKTAVVDPEGAPGRRRVRLLGGAWSLGRRKATQGVIHDSFYLLDNGRVILANVPSFGAKWVNHRGIAQTKRNYNPRVDSKDWTRLRWSGPRPTEAYHPNSVLTMSESWWASGSRPTSCTDTSNGSHLAAAPSGEPTICWHSSPLHFDAIICDRPHPELLYDFLVRAVAAHTTSQE